MFACMYTYLYIDPYMYVVVRVSTPLRTPPVAVCSSFPFLSSLGEDLPCFLLQLTPEVYVHTTERLSLFLSLDRLCILFPNLHPERWRYTAP